MSLRQEDHKLLRSYFKTKNAKKGWGCSSAHVRPRFNAQYPNPKQNTTQDENKGRRQILFMFPILTLHLFEPQEVV